MQIKHHKLKNTGILFELLSRQLTADILNDNTQSKTVNLIKQYFNENTELGKELQLYQVLLKENYASESKCNHLIDAVINSRQKLRNANLRREKYNLIKEIKDQYNLDDFFNARLQNYKVFASIYKLFLMESGQDVAPPKELVDNRYTILEHLAKSIVESNKSNSRMDEFAGQDKDLRLLAYKLIVDKFNARYSKALNKSQQTLLREYIYNVSNTNKLREFINEEVVKVEKVLTKSLSKVNDQITRIKLTESLKQLPGITKGKVVKDEQVVALMRYYQLVEEVGKSLKRQTAEKLND